MVYSTFLHRYAIQSIWKIVFSIPCNSFSVHRHSNWKSHLSYPWQTQWTSNKNQQKGKPPEWCQRVSNKLHHRKKPMLKNTRTVSSNRMATCERIGNRFDINFAKLSSWLYHPVLPSYMVGYGRKNESFFKSSTK